MSKLKPAWETGIALNTEKKQVAWLRGATRKSWTRYPTQNEYKNSMRTKAIVYDDDGNPKIYKTGKKKGEVVTRYECPCEQCKGIFPASKVQVDHIIPAGSTSTMPELLEWMEKVFCGTDNLQLLCKDCHDIKTHCDKTGLTWEQAIEDKKRIAFFKRKAPQVKKDLKKLGATDEDLRNPSTRDAFYRKYYEIP